MAKTAHHGTGGSLIDKQAASVHNGTIMIRSARNFLAGGFLLLTLPAAHAEAALERVQFDAVLMTARDYADDRSLIFYCLRGSTETVPFLYAGLQADLEQAVQKLKSAGASARQSAEMVQMVLGTVRTYARDAKDDALDRRCISKDVERSRAEVKGVSVPLFLRPPFDKMGKGRILRTHANATGAAAAMQISFASGCAGSPSGCVLRNRQRHKRPYGPTAVFRGRAFFLSKTFYAALLLRIGGRTGRSRRRRRRRGRRAVIVRSCAGSCAWSVRSLGEPAKNMRPAAKAIATRMPTTRVTPLPLLSS